MAPSSQRICRMLLSSCQAVLRQRTTTTSLSSGCFPASSSRPMQRQISSSSVSAKDGDPAQGNLPGHPNSVFLTSLNDSFFDKVKPKTLSGNPNAQGGIPTYRLLDGVGRLLPGVTDEMVDITEAEAVKMYNTMLLLPAIDVILYNAQRQGRISFMMTAHGEEGAVIGSAAGLDPRDEVFAQYRESGVLLWRDFSLDHFMSQVFGAEDDLCGGRQMPIHFGSTQHHFHTISSPLATQIPQASGAGYALKRTKGREGNVVICYFGEGAASEGDFHAGMNLASTTKSPVIFFVRNNGYAISTPAAEQFRGDGIASRGPGYGMLTIRVDGNDALAVRSAVKAAKQKALSEQRPVLIEAMTYRVGHHSTSDDSSAYRSKEAVESWKQMDNPLHRMRKFLTDRGWWTDELEEKTKASHRKLVIEAMGRAEKKKRPRLSALFEDTYQGELPDNLKEQRAELAALIHKYGSLPGWSKELEKHSQAGKDMEQYLEKSQS